MTDNFSGITPGGMLYGGDNQKMNGSAQNLDRISRVAKNFKIVAEKMVKSDDLVRLLVDNRRECLLEDEKKEISKLDKRNAMNQIKRIPVINKEEEDKTIIVLAIKDIIKDGEKYIYTFDFDVLVNLENWELADYNLRTLAIVNEIDNLFTDTKMQGIGAATFVGVESLKVNESIGGYRAHYLIEDI